MSTKENKLSIKKSMKIPTENCKTAENMFHMNTQYIPFE